MNYRLDKKTKRKKFWWIVTLCVLLIIFFLVRQPFFNTFSYLGHTIFRPVFSVGNKVGSVFHGVSSFFSSKRSLLLENEALNNKLEEQEARLANYDALSAENNILKETFGRKEDRTLVLSAILAKPNQSPYDTIIVDAGSSNNVQVGNIVFAKGFIPIGRVAEVYPRSSKVILFSNSGERTKVVITKNAALEETQGLFMDITGRGGNNFEMVLPRDFVVEKGDEVILPGITPFVVAVVDTIISDPRDAFKKALLVSPVNIQTLKFVEIDVN